MRLTRPHLVALIGLILVGRVLVGPALADTTCSGTVVIGEGAAQIATSVDNKLFHGRCFNAWIVDTAAEGANYGNHGEFVAHLGQLVGDWTKARQISLREASELLFAGLRSDVGRDHEGAGPRLQRFPRQPAVAGHLWRSGRWPRYRDREQAAGGVEYLAGYVAAAKVGHPNNVVVSAGDLIGASPLISALFHDEPTIEIMNVLGLDFNAVGNHEFDEGKAELLRMQNGGCHPTDPNSCQGAGVGTPVPFEGANFKFLSANVVDTATGKTVFPAYGIKNFKGHRVAFIGMTLQDTPTIVTPTGVAGLEFRDEADTVNALVPRLRRQGVKAIVVLVHQGGLPGSELQPGGQPGQQLHQ